jgi:predicted membrane-bound spermidine synthase
VSAWALRLGGALLAAAVLIASFVFGVGTYCVVGPLLVARPTISGATCTTFLAGASALLTPVIGTIAAYVAYQQYRTTRTTLRIHLYERRVEILRGVLAALGGVFREGKVPGETIPELLRATSEKDYLLRSDLIEYLEELYQKAVHAYTLYYEFKELPVGTERTKLVNEHAQLIEWLVNTPAELRRRFIPYLKFADADEHP